MFQANRRDHVGRNDDMEGRLEMRLRMWVGYCWMTGSDMGPAWPRKIDSLGRQIALGHLGVG